MSASDRFFQFPLCALSFGETERDRLEHIISFGFVEAGHKMFNKLDPEIQKQKAIEFAAHTEKQKGYCKTDIKHVATMLGAQEIGIRIGSIIHSIMSWNSLTSLRNQFEEKYGTDVQVRIKKDLVFEARDLTGITYREFAILCAVYSCIGAADHPVLITKETIQNRMLGYKSPKIMAAELPARNDKAQPLTLRKIGYTLKALHERKFFARARPNERQTYYSNRLTRAEMEEMLFKQKTAKPRFHAERKMSDQTLMGRIKLERMRLSAGIT